MGGRHTWLCQDCLRGVPSGEYELKVGKRYSRQISGGSKRTFSPLYAEAKGLMGECYYQDSSDTFEDLPLDRRHLDRRVQRAGIGKFKRDLAVVGAGGTRFASPPSLRDFPKEWLPKLPKKGPPAKSLSSSQ